jgi:CBS domain-containing protein
MNALGRERAPGRVCRCYKPAHPLEIPPCIRSRIRGRKNEHASLSNHLKKAPVLDGDKMVGIINRSNITKYAIDQYLAQNR